MSGELRALGGHTSVVLRHEQPPATTYLIDRFDRFDRFDASAPPTPNVMVLDGEFHPITGSDHEHRVTGWAQVKYADSTTEFDTIEKLQYDFYYLRHQALGLDLPIIRRTFRSVVGR